MTLRRKILLRKREIHLLALIQSGITKRVVTCAVFTLRHPVLNGISVATVSTYFSGIVLQVYGFVKNSSRVATGKISLLNFNLHLILGLE